MQAITVLDQPAVELQGLHKIAVEHASLLVVRVMPTAHHAIV